MKSILIALFVVLGSVAAHAVDMTVTVLTDNAASANGAAKALFNTITANDSARKFVIINEADKTEKTVELKVGPQIACIFNPPPYTDKEVQGHLCLLVTNDEGKVLPLALHPSLVGLVELMAYADGMRMDAQDFWETTGLR